MRQKKYQITETSEIEHILQVNKVGRLATNGVDGYPYVTPLNYVYSDGTVYFHCARAGERIDNIRRDSKVCFEVDEEIAYIATDFSKADSACDVTQLYRSVIIRGKAEIVEDIDEKVGALNKLMASHEAAPDFDKVTADTKAVKLCDVVKISIESMTGKQNVGKNRPESYREAIVQYKPELKKYF